MLKQNVKSALIGLRLPRIAQSFVPHRLLVLRYHSVREEPALLDAYIPVGITHSASVFRAHMKYISQNCNLVSLNDLPDFVGGVRPFPERGVLVTFDDGFRDNYEVAAPILEECGLRGVFYIPTSAVEARPLWFVRLRYWSVKAKKSHPEFLEVSGRCATLSEPEREELLAGLAFANSVEDTFTMTWGQAKDLIERGHTIGSHTVNHPNVAQCAPSVITAEMEESKKTIEAKLGIPVQHFSYPNPILQPHWDQNTEKACRLAGYRTAVTSSGGSVVKGGNLMALRRHYVADSLHEFVWNLELAFCGLNR